MPHLSWHNRLIRRARKPAYAPTGAAGSSVDVDRLVEHVMQRRHAGEEVSDAALIRRHGHLMPELGERLALLRGIDAARRDACKPPSGSEPPSEADLSFDEQRKILDDALEGYGILDRMHHGGQGVIYRAVQKSTHRVVAIKVLLDGVFASDHRRKRFEREAELLSRLRHPNIVTLYDTGVVRGRRYLAMEFVDGMSIDEYVLIHDLGVRQIIELFVQVCRAVSYAHQQGIIHRDIKPSNILVDEEGRPHVCDFGLARDNSGSPDGGMTISLSGQIVGTLPYLSPEGAAGRDGEVEVRSDIYSLGVVLFEMLTGSLPYPVHGETADVRANITTRAPLRLREAVELDPASPPERSFSTDLETIVTTALAKEKARRYQSAAALADDLERYLRGDPIAARADSALYLLTTMLRRFWIPIFVAACFMVLLLGATVVTTKAWLEARWARFDAVQKHEKAQKTWTFAQLSLNDFLTEFDEEISLLAGGIEVRDRLLTRLSARLDQLTSLVQDDPAMATILGAIEEKKGDIALAQNRRSAAEGHFRAFLNNVLGRSQTNPDAHDAKREVARAYRKLASVSDRAAWLFERSIETSRRLLEARQADVERGSVEYELCTAHVEFGRDLFRAGEFTAAARELESAIGIAESRVQAAQPESRWLNLLASAHEWDGEALSKLGEADRAISLMESSLRMRQHLCDSAPSNVQQRNKLMLAWMKLGSLYRDQGRSDDATGALRSAVDIGHYLVNVEPTVATWKRDLCFAYGRLATQYYNARDVIRALESSENSLRLARDLFDQAPNDPNWIGLLASEYGRRGVIGWMCGESSEALPDYLEAARLCARSVELYPDNSKAQSDLARAYDRLGRCYRELRQPQYAFYFYSAACDIRVALLDRHRGVVARTTDVIGSKIKLAIAHLGLRTPFDDRVARRWLREAEVSLSDLGLSDALVGQETKLDELTHVIKENQAVIARRSAKRNASNKRHACSTSEVPPE